MRILTWICRLLGVLVVGLYFAGLVGIEVCFFGAGAACAGMSPATDTSRLSGPLRFYRGINGSIHFYRKVDPVRLAKMERDLDIGIDESEVDAKPNLQSVANAYAVPYHYVGPRRVSDHADDVYAHVYKHVSKRLWDDIYWCRNGVGLPPGFTIEKLDPDGKTMYLLTSPQAYAELPMDLLHD